MMIIKIGDWIEARKQNGMISSGYVCDISVDGKYLLDNDCVVSGEIYRYKNNEVILVNDKYIILAQNSQYHPNSRSKMLATKQPQNHGKNIIRVLFAGREQRRKG